MKWIVLLLSLALVGCGGDEKSGSGNDTGGGSEKTGQSAIEQAKANPELREALDPHADLFQDISLDDAFPLALEQNKVVVIYGHAEGCEHCRLFEEEVLQDEEVDAWLDENAVLIRNRNDNESRVYFGRYAGGTFAFPSVFLINANTGGLIQRVSADSQHKIEKKVLLDAFATVDAERR